MPTYDATTATCHVFTEKDGLLSRLAHDLELDVTRFTVTVEEASVEGTFDPRSLKVLHALKDGRPSAELSEKDKRDIEASIAREVLSSAASIRFVSSQVTKAAGGVRVAGRLTLNGRERAVDVDGRAEGGRLVARVRLHQPDFGIKPFSAMMGTLKIRPGVVVRLSLPFVA